MVPIHQPRRDERHVGLGGISEPRASYQVHEITDSSSDCDPHAHKCLFFTLTVQREILEKQKPYNVQPCQYNIYINSSRREQCRKAEQTRAVWAVPAWRLKGKGRKATRKGGGGAAHQQSNKGRLRGIFQNEEVKKVFTRWSHAKN